MEITNPVLMFAFIMFVILLAPAFFARLKLPGIVGLIVSGIIVGPYALGILKSEGSFQLFSSVGLIYIMFLAGLEINLGEFKRQRKYSLVFGLLTFLIPMVVGTFGSKYLLSFSWTTAILLASMFASHTLIPFPITSRLGVNKERSVVTTIGGTIITDVAALLVLAIIAEQATADLTAIFWIRQVLLLMALVWFALWLLPRVAYTLFKMFSPDGANEFILTLALAFLTSYFAYLAGVEPIIGAFFAGIALIQLISDQSPLRNRLEFVGNTLFIPFFLISVGMLVDLRVLVSGWNVWVVSVFMVVVVIGCKYAAAFLFAKLFKFTRDEGLLIFGLSVNQAAATLAAVIVGLRLGIFDEAILNGTILMILVTCLIGPWFTEKHARRIARERLKGIAHAGRSDQRILVAVSREGTAEFLTDVALSLRPKDSREPIFPLYVVQEGMDVDQRIAFGEKILGGVVARIVSADVPVSPISRIDVGIPGGILRAVKECRAGTLILGSLPSREANLKTMLFDVSDKVCDESQELLFLCQVMRPLNIGKTLIVLIPPMLEFQKGFDRAFEALKALALGNKLHVRIVAMPQTVTYIETHLSKTGAKVEMSFLRLDEWRSLSGSIKKAGFAETDALAIMAARKGRLAWQPSLKRFFHAISAEFPQNNIMMVYPADTDSSETVDTDLKKENTLEGFLIARPAVALEGKFLDDAVEQLLKSEFSSDPKILSELTKKLFSLGPIELCPGVVLLHTHSQHLTKPLILLGAAQQGIAFPSLKKEMKSLFVLISPNDQTNIHLQALTQVVRMARDLEDKD